MVTVWSLTLRLCLPEPGPVCTLLAVSRLLLVVSVAFLAGCGGGGDQLSKQDYQQELDGARTELEASFEELGTELQKAASDSGSLDQAAEQVGQIQDDLRSTADDLDDTTPPEEVEQANDDLVEGLRTLADDLDSFKEAVESGDLGKIRDEAGNLEGLESGKQISEAAEEFEKQGYEFGNGS